MICKAQERKLFLHVTDTQKMYLMGVCFTSVSCLLVLVLSCNLEKMQYAFMTVSHDDITL